MKDLKDVKNFEDLNLRQTFRAHIIYEQIMGESFNSTAGLNGVIVLFYSHIMGSNKDASIDYDDFMDWLDEHPEMLTQFTEWYLKVSGAKMKPTEEGAEEGKKPMKKTKSKKA